MFCFQFNSRLVHYQGKEIKKRIEKNSNNNVCCVEKIGSKKEEAAAATATKGKMLKRISASLGKLRANATTPQIIFKYFQKNRFTYTYVKHRTMYMKIIIIKVAMKFKPILLRYLQAKKENKTICLCVCMCVKVF